MCPQFVLAMPADVLDQALVSCLPEAPVQCTALSGCSRIWHSTAADHALLSVEQTTYVAEDNIAEFTGDEGLFTLDAFDGDTSIRHPEARATLPKTESRVCQNMQSLPNVIGLTWRNSPVQT